MATGFGLVIYAIASGVGLGAFIDGQSALIVVGGTVGAVLINYPLKNVLGAVKVARNVFLNKIDEPQVVLEQIVGFSQTARRDGILALEESVSTLKNQFMRKGIQLVVDGESGDSLEAILDTEISYLRSRHGGGADIFASMGAYAPALGLVGTLIGLVGMLQNMDDPSTIGPSMAVALITTFYGAVLANLLFNPIAGKLRARSGEEALVWQLIREGVIPISLGDNPRTVQQKLNSFLAPKLRKKEGD